MENKNANIIKQEPIPENNNIEMEISLIEKLAAIKQIENGKSLKEVSNNYNVSPLTILCWLRNKKQQNEIDENNNIEMVKIKNRIHRKGIISTLEKLNAINRYDNGDSAKEIALDLNVNFITVHKWRQQKEILLSDLKEELIANEGNTDSNNTKKVNQTFSIDQKLDAVKRYENRETSLKIGYDMNIHPSNIRRWFNNKEKLLLSKLSNDISTKEKDVIENCSEFTLDKAQNEIDKNENIENKEIKRKRKFKISILEKINALKRYENGEEITKIACDLNVTRKTFLCWIRTKEKIISKASTEIIEEIPKKTVSLNVEI